MPNTQSRTKHEDTEYAGSLDGLKESFDEFKEDISKLLHDAMGVGSEGVGAIKERAASAIDQLGDKIQQMKKQGSNAVGKIESKMEENPLVSAAIAFGVGYIIAKILSRRR